MVRISEIAIRDTFGTEEFDFKPAQVTVIRGANETGKSSILDAIAYVFEANSDPGVIRNGAKRSTVRLGIQDGDKFLNIEKRTTPSGATYSWDGPSTMTARKYLDRLGSVMAINPAQLLAIDTSRKPGKKELTETLLKIMPIEFTRDEFSFAAKSEDMKERAHAGDALAKVQHLVGELSVGTAIDLDQVARMRTWVEKTRTDVGRDAKQASATVAKLEADIPQAGEASDAVERGKQVAALLSDISKDVKVATDQENLKHAGLMVDVNREFQAEMEAVRNRFDQKKAGIGAEHQKILDAITAAETEARADLLAEQAALKERIAAAQRAAGARATVALMRVEATAKTKEYAKLTCALSILDVAKTYKLATLPIPGLLFEDGDVFYNAVRWQDVNTQNQVQLCMQICSMIGGELQFMILDNAEHLDEKKLNALLAGLVDAGYQIIYAEVRSDSPLTIEVVK